MTQSSVLIHITPTSLPSAPSWLGEVAVFAQVLNHVGVLNAIQQRVRFARARMGRYDLIDFVVVLIGYAISGEETLKAFYERLSPFADIFMACFGRSQLPDRTTLSRFLAALDEAPVEALRTLFLQDLVARTPFEPPGGLSDRQGSQWWVIDVDGTKQAARQRALPHRKGLPAPHRRLDQVCAPGYKGRKRGEVVRTRTTVLQAFTHQWMGTYGGAGNGDYRGELKRAAEVILWYALALGLPVSQMLVRLDGLYGNAAPLTDVVSAGLGLIARSKDYGLLKLEAVQVRLTRPADFECTHPESGAKRALYDCPDIPLAPGGPRVRLVVAVHPATSEKPKIGVERDRLVYELFVSTLPKPAFSPKDVLDLYLHRGSFEPVLADEDKEQDPDRWCSFSPMGQEFWQILSQWVWNIRLELGQHLLPTAVRTTEFAPKVEPLAISSPPESELAVSSDPTATREPLPTSHPPASQTPTPESELTVQSSPTATCEPLLTSNSPASQAPTPESELTAQSSPTATCEPLLTSNSPASQTPTPESEPPATGEYSPPQWARRSFTGGFPGSAFTPQPDGSLLCPANHPLSPVERRPEPNGAYRILYAARIGDCQACPLREKCQESSSTKRPRRVSAVIFPSFASPKASASLEDAPSEQNGGASQEQKEHSLVDHSPPSVPDVPVPGSPSPLPRPTEPPSAHPVLWQDWPRCQIRRHWLKVIRSETVGMSLGVPSPQTETSSIQEPVLTRAERAHWRLSWNQRLMRNARQASASQLTLTLHGLPTSFAHHYGFSLLDVA